LLALLVSFLLINGVLSGVQASLPSVEFFQQLIQRHFLLRMPGFLLRAEVLKQFLLFL
jgi:hypothetical protein